MIGPGRSTLDRLTLFGPNFYLLMLLFMLLFICHFSNSLKNADQKFPKGNFLIVFHGCYSSLNIYMTKYQLVLDYEIYQNKCNAFLMPPSGIQNTH